MNKMLLLFAAITLSLYSIAQISTIIPSSSAIAQTSVSDSHGLTAFNNPAMLGYISTPEVGIQFENRYFISELSTKSFQVGLPTKLINAGLSFSHFGYSLYHEIILGMGFARNFSDKFAMGVQFNYYTAYFNASNSYRGALLAQVGLSAKLSPVFSVGFNTFNLFQTSIQTEYVTKRLPSIFSFGTEYFFSHDLVWRTQIDKEVSSNYRFATGFEYELLEQFRVKLGAYGSDYLVPCLGVGYRTGAFLIHLNCESHPLIGLNTHASIIYKFGH